MPKISEKAEFAYVVAALVMFGSGVWASVMPIDYRMVMVIMSVPSLFLGYYFAPVYTKYILGMLTGLMLYMMVEYFLYGPVYRITGLIYAAAYIFAVSGVLTARFFYMQRERKRQVA